LIPEFDPEDIVETKVIEHIAPATDRSVARRIALQALYELDTTTHKLEDVIGARVESQTIDSKQVRYVEFLVQGVLSHQEQLDDVIRQHALEWPPEQLAVLDRNILRMALLEFGIEERAPIGVVIDEAVGLARLFGAETALSFINGVLGKIASDETMLQALRSMKSDDGELVV
jgi:N utilization substance protein B